MTTIQESFVRAEIVGGTGVLTLTRERPLNALNRDMYHQILGALQMWREDPVIQQVVIRSSTPRALCAGGDIKEVREAALDRRPEDIMDAFGTEYAMNAVIAEYPKPVVAMMNGIVMGGGMGLSVHGTHRIVTETSQLAMPETAIGFFTDIGASYFLPRVTRGSSAVDAAESLAVGRYLGLGGVRMDAHDAIALGLADTLIDSANVDAFVDLVTTAGPDAAVERFGKEPGDSAIVGRWDEIVAAYGGDSLETIVERESDAFQGMSPTSLVRVFELLNRGAQDDNVRSCLERELRMAVDCASAPDFAEGVRAMVVDKDKNPQWSPATLAEVDVDAIRALADEKRELPAS